MNDPTDTHTSAGDGRPTPWELIFGVDSFDASRFEEVRSETDEAAGASPTQLFMKPAAGALLREFVPPGGGREMVAQVGALVFAAYRFWLHGRHVYRLGDTALRSLLSTQREFTAPLQPPSAAGYVQLPRHLMWARVSEEEAAEPVDGFFWSVPSGDEGGPDRLDLLFALGVRAGRPGLSLFDVTVESPVQLEQWANVRARTEGDDFANILPGGELQGYRAIVTAAEALKLAALCFAHVADPSQTWNVMEMGGQIVHVASDG